MPPKDEKTPLAPAPGSLQKALVATPAAAFRTLARGGHERLGALARRIVGHTSDHLQQEPTDGVKALVLKTEGLINEGNAAGATDSFLALGDRLEQVFKANPGALIGLCRRAEQDHIDAESAARKAEAESRDRRKAEEAAEKAKVAKADAEAAAARAAELAGQADSAKAKADAKEKARAEKAAKASAPPAPAPGTPPAPPG